MFCVKMFPGVGPPIWRYRPISCNCAPFVVWKDIEDKAKAEGLATTLATELFLEAAMVPLPPRCPIVVDLTGSNRGRIIFPTSDQPPSQAVADRMREDPPPNLRYERDYIVVCNQAAP